MINNKKRTVYEVFSSMHVVAIVGHVHHCRHWHMMDREFGSRKSHRDQSISCVPIDHKCEYKNFEQVLFTGRCHTNSSHFSCRNPCSGTLQLLLWNYAVEPVVFPMHFKYMPQPRKAAQFSGVLIDQCID
jgi:hypothetical protein